MNNNVFIRLNTDGRIFPNMKIHGGTAGDVSDTGDRSFTVQRKTQRMRMAIQWELKNFRRKHYSKLRPLQQLLYLYHLAFAHSQRLNFRCIMAPLQTSGPSFHSWCTKWVRMPPKRLASANEISVWMFLKLRRILAGGRITSSILNLRYHIDIICSSNLYKYFSTTVR